MTISILFIASRGMWQTTARLVDWFAAHLAWSGACEVPVIAATSASAAKSATAACPAGGRQQVDAWRVCHVSLVLIMFAIAVGQVVPALYMGYAPFMD